jgi:DNA-binding LacI/PurR family transcriptional regulator
VTGAVTIYDVAARAGVSISTVSQVINRPGRVNPQTRDRVLKAVEDLSYVPKAAAVSHARQGVGRIGVLAPFTSYDSYRRRLMGVLAESDGTSRDVVVYDHESAAASVSPLLRILPATGRLDGLLIMGLPLDDKLAENLLTRRLPTVLVDSARPEFHTVNVDDEEGGAIAARHLLGRGHRTFAFVQEPQESDEFLSQGQRRNRGFLREVAAAGGDPEAVHIVLTSNDVAGSRESLHEVLARRPVPTAVFAHHDTLAAGLLVECRRQGVRVPDDLAVVGFDDGSIAEAAALTTVRQPFEESGRLGARLLGDLLGGTSQSRQHIVLGLELVVRDST